MPTAECLFCKKVLAADTEEELTLAEQRHYFASKDPDSETNHRCVGFNEFDNDGAVLGRRTWGIGKNRFDSYSPKQLGYKS